MENEIYLVHKTERIYHTYLDARFR